MRKIVNTMLYNLIVDRHGLYLDIKGDDGEWRPVRVLADEILDYIADEPHRLPQYIEVRDGLDLVDICNKYFCRRKYLIMGVMALDKGGYEFDHRATCPGYQRKDYVRYEHIKSRLSSDVIAIYANNEGKCSRRKSYYIRRSQ